MATTPFTTDATIPTASVTSRRPPAGWSATKRTPVVPTVSGSKSTRSAARPGKDATAIGEAEQVGLVGGELAHGVLEREHAAFPDPVLQRPHRVARVGVRQHVRARVGRTDHRRRVCDHARETLVVVVGHARRELRLEVVGDGDVEQHVGGMHVPFGREVAHAATVEIGARR